MIQKIRKACLGNFWFLLTGFFLLWEPAYIKTQLYWVDKLFDVGSLLLLMLVLVFYAGRRKITSFDWALLAMGVIMSGSTLFHQGLSPELWKCAKYMWPILLAVLLTEMGAEENPDGLIRAQYVMCFVQVAANFLSVALCPAGLYRGSDNEPQFWLGNENVFIITILAGLCAGYLSVLRRKKKMSWDYVCFFLLSLGCIIPVWSATGLIAMTVFALAFGCSFLLKWRWLYMLKTYIGVWCAGFFAITIFRLQFLFKPIIVGLLHKKLNLTRRTKVWNKVLKAVKKSPVWGYGVESAQAFSERLGGDPHRVHAHNYILELLMKGGALLLIAFAALLFLTARKLDGCIKSREAKVISITLLAYFIAFIGDSFEMRTLFYMVLALGFCCEKLLEGGIQQ